MICFKSLFSVICLLIEFGCFGLSVINEPEPEPLPSAVKESKPDDDDLSVSSPLEKIPDLIRDYINSRYFDVKDKKGSNIPASRYAVSKDSKNYIRLLKMAASTEKPLCPSRTNVIVLPLLIMAGFSKNAANLLKLAGVGGAHTLFANGKVDANFEMRKLESVLSLFNYQRDSSEAEPELEAEDDESVGTPKRKRLEKDGEISCRCEVYDGSPKYKILSDCDCDAPIKPKLKKRVLSESETEPKFEETFTCKCKAPVESPKYRTLSECECKAPIKPKMRTIVLTEPEPESKTLSCKCDTPNDSSSSSQVCLCGDSSRRKYKMKFKKCA